MKNNCLLIAVLLAGLLLPLRSASQWKGKSVDFKHGKLTVSADGHFIVHEDGTPFFYFGDTAWELFHRLDEAEIEKYLENRRSKGFTVIQAVILAEFDGLNTPDRYGEKPLTDNDPARPNDKYFEWVDKVVRMAESKGLYMGLLPTWGDKVDKMWGIGPVVFNPENAYTYGKYLGERYKDFKNIIWINGGDRPGDNAFAVWDALARGIKSADANHLMTFHPRGLHSSSVWFKDSDWLDFNMSQSGHSDRSYSYSVYARLIGTDYKLKPAKPCINGEPCYEDHPVNHKPADGWFDDMDSRCAMYWSLFTGACGHTYGCHPMWQFYSPRQKPISHARHYWYDMLDVPGAFAITYARKLMESTDFLSLVPDNGIVLTPQNDAKEQVVAMRGKRCALVYIPYGQETEVSLEKIEGAKKLKLQWFDPRNGKSLAIGTVNAQDKMTLIPPTQGRGNDWVLVMNAR